MTDERMTQGDVRLRYLDRRALRDGLHEHQEDGSHSPTSICWYCDTLAEKLAPTVERIVAARVGEVVERVEAALVASDDGSEHEHNDGCQGEPTCPACWVEAVRAALRAADAPVSGRERDGGRGGAGGDERAGDGL